MKITYFGKKILFPIREGLDRLTWDMAQAVKKENFNVEIRGISKRKKIMNIEGIRIVKNRLFSLSYFKTDILHLLIHPNPQIIFPLLFCRAKKIFITIADGEMGSFWEKWWSPIIKWIIKKKVNKIFVQTAYQQKRLGELGLKSDILYPYIKKIKRKAPRSKAPSLLYMGVPSKRKGFLDCVKAFYNAKKVIKNLKFIIANSQINNKEELSYKHLKKDKNIIIKDTIDREKELSKAWIYLYPIKSAQNTMALPISLIEAINTKTAFISTKVGGISELFPDNFLINPNSPKEIKEKIIEFVKKYPKNINFKRNVRYTSNISKLIEEYKKNVYSQGY